MNQHIQARFKLPNIKQEDLEQMLLNCYEAEVVKRRMKLIQDNVTVGRIKKVAKWLTGEYKTGLLLYGASCGTGKTTIANAICTLISYIYDGSYNVKKNVYKTTAINLVKLYSDNPDEYRSMANKELLFIDDLGVEAVNIKVYGNEFSPVTELLYNRYDRNLVTILTSNLSDEQMKDRYGARIDDRLREMFDKIHFQGPSYRK